VLNFWGDVEIIDDIARILSGRRLLLEAAALPSSARVIIGRPQFRRYLRISAVGRIPSVPLWRNPFGPGRVDEDVANHGWLPFSIAFCT